MRSKMLSWSGNYSWRKKHSSKTSLSTSAEVEWGEQGGEALAKVKDLRDTLKAENIVIDRIL